MKPIRLALLLLVPLPGCRTGTELSPADVQAVEATLADYRQAWLDGDAEQVLVHVSDSVTLFVPGAGAATVVGKPAARDFWFPSSGTRYPIKQYDITGQTVFGGGGYAIAQGNSFLSWDTVVGDSVASSSSSKSEYLTVLRHEAGTWRIYRLIYVMR